MTVIVEICDNGHSYSFLVNIVCIWNSYIAYRISMTIKNLNMSITSLSSLVWGNYLERSIII